MAETRASPLDNVERADVASDLLGAGLCALLGLPLVGDLYRTRTRVIAE